MRKRSSEVRKLAAFYDKRVTDVGRSALRNQVGHSEAGRPFSDAQFQTMITELIDLLDLQPGDRVLDLCCGNGIITRELATIASEVVGIDLSPALIDIARESCALDNTVYLNANILKKSEVLRALQPGFDKVLMYAALQHFRDEDLKPLLEMMVVAGTPETIIVLGMVTDRAKRNAFFDTPKRRLEDRLRRLTGRNYMGHWWNRAFISATCDRLGLTCTFHEIDRSLSSSRYRFHARITAPPDHAQ